MSCNSAWIRLQKQRDNSKENINRHYDAFRRTPPMRGTKTYPCRRISITHVATSHMKSTPTAARTGESRELTHFVKKSKRRKQEQNARVNIPSSSGTWTWRKRSWKPTVLEWMSLESVQSKAARQVMEGCRCPLSDDSFTAIITRVGADESAIAETPRPRWFARSARAAFLGRKQRKFWGNFSYS
jgi:hypothetical protein